MENMQIAMPDSSVRGTGTANDNAALPGESMVVDDAAVSDSILRAKAKTRRAIATGSIPQHARWQRVANALIAGVRERFGFDRKD